MPSLQAVRRIADVVGLMAKPENSRVSCIITYKDRTSADSTERRLHISRSTNGDGAGVQAGWYAPITNDNDNNNKNKNKNKSNKNTADASAPLRPFPIVGVLTIADVRFGTGIFPNVITWTSVSKFKKEALGRISQGACGWTVHRVVQRTQLTSALIEEDVLWEQMTDRRRRRRYDSDEDDDEEDMYDEDDFEDAESEEDSDEDTDEDSGEDSGEDSDEDEDAGGAEETDTVQRASPRFAKKRGMSEDAATSDAKRIKSEAA